jgi:hypothetical protein
MIEELRRAWQEHERAQQARAGEGEPREPGEAARPGEGEPREPGEAARPGEGKPQIAEGPRGPEAQQAGEGEGRQPGEGAGQQPGEGTGQQPGEGTGQQPGEGTGQQPGEGAGQQPGEGTGQQPGEGTGQQPGEGTGQQPGEGTGQQPGEGAGRQPGEGTGQQPGEGAGLEGTGIAETGGKGEGEALPGPAEGERPGQVAARPGTEGEGEKKAVEGVEPGPGGIDERTREVLQEVARAVEEDRLPPEFYEDVGMSREDVQKFVRRWEKPEEADVEPREPKSDAELAAERERGEAGKLGLGEGRTAAGIGTETGPPTGAKDSVRSRMFDPERVGPKYRELLKAYYMRISEEGSGKAQ